MSILFILIPALLLITMVLMAKILKGARVLKSLSMFIFILGAIVLAFVLDNTRPGHVAKAIESVKSLIQSPVMKTNSFLEENFNMSIIKIKEKSSIDAPLVLQLPELPRGCEVTSLAMLLQHAGQDVDKLTLAKKIRKDPTTYKEAGGKIYFGNPHDGFVGNMYTFDKPGLGVYHEPIRELAEKYLPGRIKDLTGSNFQEMKIHLSDGRPVWVITNTTYSKLPSSFFQTWHTPSGKIDVTYKEHSVLLTGYDGESIYFNDPLTGEKNKKAPLTDFEESWVQMGRQAITYLQN